MRPDKIHVVVDITVDGVFAVCRVDPAYPKALNDYKMKVWLRVLATQHTVLSIIGRRRTIISETPEGRKKLREMGLADNEVTWDE
jgi:hypothetical protein